jgi:uncharacterized membrane protein YhfC
MSELPAGAHGRIAAARRRRDTPPVAPETAWAWIVGAVGCLLVAFAPVVFWRRRHGVRATDYLLGAAAWAATVGAKVVASLAVGGVLYLAFAEAVPLPVEMAVSGLLTGVFEIGGTLAAVLLVARLRTAGWGPAVAFGIGFGAFEALVLAPPLFVSGMTALVAYPGMDAESVRATLANLADTARPLEVVWERAAALAVHTLACVLVIGAVRARRAAPFWGAFVLKTALDSVPPDAGLPRLALQGVYGAFGVASIVLLLCERRRFHALDSAVPVPPPAA